VDLEDFWRFLERSAAETTDPTGRLAWLEQRLSRIARRHIVDFQIHLETVRRPTDTYTMWGAANQILDGMCGTDAFWYFQFWLIGQGQHWWQHAVRDPDNLADLPAVQILAGRPMKQWNDSEWPWWQDLPAVAPGAHDQITGEQDSIDGPMAEQGYLRHFDPMPADQPWDDNDPTEIHRRLPRLADLFPRHHKPTA